MSIKALLYYLYFFSGYGYHSDSDFQGLLFESLCFLLPKKNPESMKLKSKIWNIIEEYSFEPIESEVYI